MANVVLVSKRPPCDFCGSPATYDGVTTAGVWAVMCDVDFRTYGVGLGTGRGQRLELRPPQSQRGLSPRQAVR